MNKVYLDNAATTPVDPEVLGVMLPFLSDIWGNPNSTHSHGREARSAIEAARKTIASLIGAKPGEIYFTSGGTESDNAAIKGIAAANEIRHILTSPIEHHAVLHTVNHLALQGVKVSYVDVNAKGELNFDQINEWALSHKNGLMSFMHANNEIGNVNPLERINQICQNTGHLLFSDTVQTLGHLPLNVNQLNITALSGSAHKIHGPKGIGLLYLKKDTPFTALIDGGGQEKGARGGTENVASIVGYAKALELAYSNLDKDKTHILSLKERLMTGLTEVIPGISFNGHSGDLQQSLYTVLNCSLPQSDINSMLLFSLDLQGISASGGSACSSGALTGSHVLEAIGHDPERGAIRFSFSKMTSSKDIDQTIMVLKEINS